jgi:hypothetical protein
MRATATAAGARWRGTHKVRVYMENRGGGTKGRGRCRDRVGEAREGAARKTMMEEKAMRFGMIERQEWTARFGKQSHGEAGRRQSPRRVKLRERMILPTRFFSPLHTF